MSVPAHNHAYHFTFISVSRIRMHTPMTNLSCNDTDNDVYIHVCVSIRYMVLVAYTCKFIRYAVRWICSTHNL